MSTNWEERFASWAKPSAETEKEKMENTEHAIRDAIDNAEELAEFDLNIEVFAHGSYKNRTNVRQDSDVDICVHPKNLFFYDLPVNHLPSNMPEHYDIGPAKITYSEFKNLVEQALIKKFGINAVTRGNKAFTVRENTYRVSADVLATFEHRRYTGRHNQDETHHYLTGIEFAPDKGLRIINWPQQTYDNGIAKNDATNKRFKAVIRILKNLRNEMQGNNVERSKDIHSFLIESLVWNVPNDGFGHDTLIADVRYVIAHTFNETRNYDSCKEWGEVNELKYLFRPTQPWTREKANSFLDAVWNYLGFE